jgi:hypothetical protein
MPKNFPGHWPRVTHQKFSPVMIIFQFEKEKKNNISYFPWRLRNIEVGEEVE